MRQVKLKKKQDEISERIKTRWDQWSVKTKLEIETTRDQLIKKNKARPVNCQKGEFDSLAWSQLVPKTIFPSGGNWRSRAKTTNKVVFQFTTYLHLCTKLCTRKYAMHSIIRKCCKRVWSMFITVDKSILNYLIIGT